MISDYFKALFDLINPGLDMYKDFKYYKFTTLIFSMIINVKMKIIKIISKFDDQKTQK